MSAITVTYTFTNGAVADAVQVNQNFTDLINGTSDGTKDFSINALTVAGAATLNGNVTLGNASADDVTVTGSLASSIPIKTNATFDFGSSTLGLASIYLGSAGGKTTRIVGGATNSHTYTLPVDNAAGVLTNPGTGVLTWSSTAGSIGSDPSEMLNVGLSVTASSSILTMALKQADGSTNPSTGTSAVKVSMRSSTVTSGAYNERSITAALSQTISQGTSFNWISSQNNYLWIYLIDSDGAGAMKIGASPIRLDDGSVQSTVAESFTATISNASPGVVTANGHGLANNDRIAFTTSGGLPTGLTAGVLYYVVNKAANTFQVSASLAGTAINTSSAGSGTHTVHIASPNLVSDAVYTSKPVRLIGRAQFNITSGNWAAPAEVCLAGSIRDGETIAVRYHGSNTSSVTNSTNIALGINTRDIDTHSLWDNSNFIAPISDWYEFKIQGEFSAFSAGGAFSTNITSKTNGVAGASYHNTYPASVSDVWTNRAADAVFLNKNDYISFTIFQNSGGAQTVGNGPDTFITISRAGK